MTTAAHATGATTTTAGTVATEELRPAATRTWSAIGTHCAVLADTEEIAAQAASIARHQLAALDAACSRFRSDSELSRLPHGHSVPVSALLAEVLAGALQAASLTRGLVDPTVGTALRDLGYDEDFDLVAARTTGSDHAARQSSAPTSRPAPGWWRVQVDPRDRTALLPHGVELDLGSIGKAWAADRIAALLAHRLPGSFLVNLGGDLAVSGSPRTGGWRIAVDHTGGVPQTVTVRSGGLATSSTRRRVWRGPEGVRHHIVDPRTGDCAPAVWSEVTTAARSCTLANAASTASVVLGDAAPAWLTERGIPAKLTGADGTVVRTCGWPEDTDGAQR